MSRNTEKIQCNKCELEFKERSELRIHMKKTHASTVARCWKFKDGNCNLSNGSCWFIHEENSPHKENDVTMEEAPETTNNSVFHEAMQKTPPDQMSQLITIITKLTLKVENLEKMAQIVN